MTSKTHWFKNAMRVYPPKLICSTGVKSEETRAAGYSKLAPTSDNNLGLDLRLLNSWFACTISCVYTLQF